MSQYNVIFIIDLISLYGVRFQFRIILFLFKYIHTLWSKVIGRFLREKKEKWRDQGGIEITKKWAKKTKGRKKKRRRGKKNRKELRDYHGRGRGEGEERAISRQRAFAAAGPVAGSFSRVNHDEERGHRGWERRRRRKGVGKRAAEGREKKKKENEKKASSEQLGNRQESRVIVWR